MRRLNASLVMAVVVLMSFVGRSAWGQAQYTVTSLTDSTNSGSLPWAITQANQQSGPASINFNISGGGTISLTALGMLPVLTNPNGITIDGSNGGQGSITIDGGSVDRMFFIGTTSDTPGNWSATPSSTQFTIENLTLQNGRAHGGDGNGGAGGGAGLGGAIFLNAGTLDLSNVSVRYNNAIGGNSWGGSGLYGSGGGGMGGSGGSGGNGPGGGGGGGFGTYGQVGTGATGSGLAGIATAGKFNNGTSGGVSGGNSGGSNGGGGGSGRQLLGGGRWRCRR